MTPDRVDVDRVIVETHRASWGRLLSVLMARTRRLDLAEDALGEAFARASERWPGEGVPANPEGWLLVTASRLVVGGLRAEAMRGRKAPLLALTTTAGDPTVDHDLARIDDGTAALGDERLALLLLCCHPALHPEARSPLALRLVVGTATAEIARLFLVPVATMAARITRAKKKIVAAGIPLGLPVEAELRTRLDDVCRTIYLAFTAGYTPGEGDDLLRVDLAGEAVELASVLHRLAPDADQARALHGLLVLQHARRHSRVRDGQLVTLADQDRSRWRAEELQLGIELVTALAPGEGYGEELRLQGLIAVEHARASTAAATDWAAIAQIYQDLEALTGSAIVRLNRSVAVAEADGPTAGLTLLDDLDEVLADHHRFHAVRSELARRAGRVDQARTSARLALELCGNAVERHHLKVRLDELG